MRDRAGWLPAVWEGNDSCVSLGSCTLPVLLVVTELEETLFLPNENTELLFWAQTCGLGPNVLCREFAGGLLESKIPGVLRVWYAKWSIRLVEGGPASSCQSGCHQAPSPFTNALRLGDCPTPGSHHLGKQVGQKDTSFQTHLATCFSLPVPNLYVAELNKERGRQEGWEERSVHFTSQRG